MSGNAIMQYWVKRIAVGGPLDEIERDLLRRDMDEIQKDCRIFVRVVAWSVVGGILLAVFLILALGE